MNPSVKETKLKIINAGYKAIEELIKIAEDKILADGDNVEDIAADKLKNAAATKRIAIFDAFDILTKIEAERDSLEDYSKNNKNIDTKQGFAERRSQR